MITQVMANEKVIAHTDNLCLCTKLWSGDSYTKWPNQVPWNRAAKRVRLPTGADKGNPTV